MRRGRGAPAAILACLLIAVASAACSDDDPAPAAAERPASEPSQPEPDPVCPLTGEEPPKGVSLEREAIAVKVENSEASRPQSGLEDADVVFEEIVEGGITRFMAVYHCGDAKKVGPVRSARFDDPKIALPFTNVIAYSGSNKIVDAELKKKKMVRLNELNESNAFFRVPPGVLDVHNLFTNVARLRAAAKGPRVHAPKNAFEFGRLDKGAKRARRVTVHFNASNAVEYRWRGGLWKRWEAGAPFRSATAGQIGVPNVLVQQVEVNNSKKIVDPAGNPSPDIALEGKGTVWLLRDGRVIKGTWRVSKTGDAPVYRTRKGDPLLFDVGPIWVELVPSRKGEVKGSVDIR
jgi:hypothetical protein